ncbi:hypothetical protein [Caballeronia sp. RCC_10]|uniref:hypothetical protein n=1 Tax=Caballeronia sp. RCC_10 TaxID=3239227 RepID=UPI0035254793
MTFLRISLLFIVALLLLGGCATRPINPPIIQYVPTEGPPFEKLDQNRGDQQDLVVLAFSGGGTRAAALSYGVLKHCGASRLLPRRADRSVCWTKSM